MALSISGYAYLLEGGRVYAEGTPAALEQDTDIAAAYLGVEAAVRHPGRSRLVSPALIEVEDLTLSFAGVRALDGSPSASTRASSSP